MSSTGASPAAVPCRPTPLTPEPSPAPAATPPTARPLTGHPVLAAPGLVYRESPNQGARFAPGLPDMVVLHYTAGGSVRSALATLRAPRAGVSAHLLVGREGEVVQLVPLDTVAFHAGVSVWQGRPGVNSRSLGIEQVNWGRLEGGPGAWRSWTGAPVPDEQVHVASDGSGWQRYPEPQIVAVIALVRLLSGRYPIRWLVGHEQVAPGRKQDPGPAFPWARVRSAVDMQEAA